MYAGNVMRLFNGEETFLDVSEYLITSQENPNTNGGTVNMLLMWSDIIL